MLMVHEAEEQFNLFSQPGGTGTPLPLHFLSKATSEAMHKSTHQPDSAWKTCQPGLSFR